MVNLLVWIGAPAAAWPPPGLPPAHTSDDKRGAAQSAEESHSLEPGKPIERELSGGRSHFYKINLTSGQYLQIAVSQRGIDVVVALYTPDGKKIDDADSEHATAGSESISAIAEAAGAYMVEARSAEKTAQTGRYEIKVEELRAATAEDKYRVAGETIFREAERLGNGTTDDKRKSIKKYHEALDLYRRAGARVREALTLNNIGLIYQSLGETQKALERFNESLPISRAVGNRRGEASMLNNIGMVYQSLGETQKALEKYNEALLLSRTVGYRIVEAVTLHNIGEVYHSLRETQKALAKYNEALPIRRTLGDRSGEAATLHNIGAVYRSLGETQKALEKYNEALPIFQFVGARNGEAAALLGIAQVEQQRGNLTQALQTIQQAVGMIESLRTNIAGQRLRASYFASRQEFYQSYIDVLMRMQMQNPTAAFDSLALEVSERARARSLLELLMESRPDLRQGVDGSLLERKRSLQQLLNAKAAAQFALLNRKYSRASRSLRQRDSITHHRVRGVECADSR